MCIRDSPLWCRECATPVAPWTTGSDSGRAQRPADPLKVTRICHAFSASVPCALSTTSADSAS
eukprot:1997764-Pyramimonas_sp.AAC.1